MTGLHRLTIPATVRTRATSASYMNQRVVAQLRLDLCHYAQPLCSSFSSSSTNNLATSQSWSKEWKQLGLGARLPKQGSYITNLLFVQNGFGVDQHGDRSIHGATKAAVRAVRNAIEFNSIPGVIEAVPGGRAEMLIQVKLGVPPRTNGGKVDKIQIPMDVDLSEVSKVFPYGRLLPIDVVVGGLSFPTGRIVTELGDEDDMAVCVAASVSIGYDNGSRRDGNAGAHKTYDTTEGY